MSGAGLRRLAAAGLLVAAAGAQAAEWVIDRSVASRLSYNDNITMRSDDEQEDTFLTVTPALGLSSRTEARDIGLNLSVGGNWYRRRTEYNTTDYTLNAGSKWLAERDQWNLAAGSVRDSTLQSESQQSELATTGVVTTRRQRTLNSVQGGWQHSFGDTWSGNVAYSNSQVRYESGPGLVDYDDQMASAGLSSSLSERATLTLAMSSREYETTNGDVRTQVDAVSLGGNWQWSERLGFGVSVGRQWNENDQKHESGCYVDTATNTILSCFLAGTTHSESTGTTYSGNLGYQFEQGSFGVSLSRGLTASGTGALLRTDSFGLGYTQRLDEALSLNLGAGQTRSRHLDSQNADNRYSSLSSSLGWQVDERVRLGVSLTHSRQSATGQATKVRGNLLFFTLNWSLEPLSRGW